MPQLDIGLRVRAVFVATVTSLMLWVGGAPPAFSQTYPDRTIKIIMPLGPGGVGDVYLRALAPELGKRLGQPIVIENKPGAFTIVGAQSCAQSPPDGYTLCALAIDTLSLAPFLFDKLAFDPEKDFAPISRLFFIGQGLMVHPSLGVKTVQELVDLSKSKPRTLSYVAQANQITLFMEEFKRVTGADIQRIPFNSGGQASTALLGGQVPVGYFAISNMLQQAQTGVVTMLAVDSPKRSPQLPNVPTLVEAGYAGAPIRPWFGLFAPAGTSETIINRLHAELIEIEKDALFIERHLTSRNIESALLAPAEFSAFLTADRDEARRLIADSGLKPQ